MFIVLTTWALAAALPAAAHGVGGRIDLPIPVWQFAWAAALAVIVSFAMLGRFWTRPRLESAAPGVSLPELAQAIGRLCVPLARLVGLAAFVVLLYAALVGSREVTSNIAPYAVFIVFWVGVQLVSAVIGDVWAGLDPFRTLADIGAWLRAEAIRQPMSPAGHGAGNRWWAVGAMFTFVWLELAYHGGASPRSIGAYLSLYTGVMVVGASVRGRGWVKDADGFGVLFGILAAMAPLNRDRSGTWRLRSPVAGLATLEASPATVRLILVVLGSTTFDGFARSSLWLDVVSNRSGWILTALNTGGLIFGIGVVMFVYRMAIAAMARTTGEPEDELGDAFAPSLLPIVVAYTVAHYFSYLVLDGQAVIRLASDPFGMGWDLFGSTGYRVDYTLLSTAAIAWIQTAAIAVGHVLAVLVAHDRAVERYPHPLAVRSQYPMLAAMIVYTVSGLLLLLGG
ncbi:MAG: fenitrothion hydrolase [bacterium]|nr:fenitrothion hydrolase [bacterium]MDE0437915.1 fenitrothion hydrolase [bacterium]